MSQESHQFHCGLSTAKKLPEPLLCICIFCLRPGRLGNNQICTFLGEPPPFANYLAAPDSADSGCKNVALLKKVKPPFGKIVKRDRYTGRIHWRMAADRADLQDPVFSRGDHNGRAHLCPTPFFKSNGCKYDIAPQVTPHIISTSAPSGISRLILFLKRRVFLPVWIIHLQERIMREHYGSNTTDSA